MNQTEEAFWHWGYRMLLVGFLLLAGGPPALGQLGATITPPTALNTNADSDSGNDYDPQVTSDGAGNWVAVWRSREDLGGPIGTDNDILVARSIENGASWSDSTPLNTSAGTDSGDDLDPQLTTDGAGNWVAVWRSFEDLGGAIGTDYDILVARSIDNGASWSDPAPLNTNAATDSGSDGSPQVTTDGAGNWVAVWRSFEDLGGAIGTDGDILVARSTDNGASWSEPAPLNTSAGTDSGGDYYPQLTTDGAGNWVAVWHSFEDLGGAVGSDYDILVARSIDNGASWSDPAPLNTNAATDSGDDYYPQLTTDGAGNWVAVWYSDEDLGGAIGSDADILVARFALPDCNENGIGDGQDIADGVSQDCNSDGVPDECQTDTDGDGIIDDCDDCPGTAEGDPVDGDGCSTADDDGDGVLNDEDDCPDTPQGAAVDASGCPAGCCGASGPVAPLGLAIGMLLLSRFAGYRRAGRR